MSAYVSQLNSQLPASDATASRKSLETRFLEWHASLPEFSRDRRFAMSEFEDALGTQGKYLSPVLMKLGWQRKRIWSNSGQYNRYWVPPTR